MDAGQGRLFVVSNRLPVHIDGQGDQLTLNPSSGGLVTALKAVLRDQKVVWVGWPGAERSEMVESLLVDAAASLPYTLEPVFLSPEEVNGFYCGFSNEVVWPLFHDLQSRCNFDPGYWQTYQEVNRKFALAVSRLVTAEDFVWVHDYHLMLVAEYLRKMGVNSTLGFFQHIPFPPAEIFEKLPWRSQILRSLLEFDVVGFQTLRDRRNFNAAIRTLVSGVEIRRTGERFSLQLKGHRCASGHFPISIDFAGFAADADTAEVAQQAEQIKGELRGVQIVLGVDRLDYTKGVPERLRAFDFMLRKYPDLRHRITMVQVVVPSREDIPNYQGLKTEIEGMVSRINGEFAQPGWVPIHYLHRHLSRLELLAYYRSADIALVTPLKDGMNLVAKEFCACQVENRGVLILSEFAGAASDLSSSVLLVNPYDVDAVADAIHEAFCMDAVERQRRMVHLRQIISRNDVYRWADSFLRAAAAVHLPRIIRARPVGRAA